MKNIFKKFDFNILTLLVIFLYLFSGLFKDFIIYFIIIFIHELGHAITGVLLGWNLKCIYIYPFGGYTKFDEDINRPIKEEFLILMMGPVVQIIIVSIFILLTKDLSISDLLIKYNFSILVFNLIPIYPLDGGRIINLLFNKKISFLKSFNISIFMSCLLLIILILISIKFNLLINFISILCFLGVLIYKEYKNKKYYFNKFRLERFLNNYEFNSIKKINNDKEMMRDKKHVLLYRNRYITEKEYLKKVFKK